MRSNQKGLSTSSAHFEKNKVAASQKATACCATLETLSVFKRASLFALSLLLAMSLMAPSFAWAQDTKPTEQEDSEEPLISSSSETQSMPGSFEAPFDEKWYESETPCSTTASSTQVEEGNEAAYEAMQVELLSTYLGIVEYSVPVEQNGKYAVIGNFTGSNASQHAAVDIGPISKTYEEERGLVLAAADGVVVDAESHYSWGNYVKIKHADGNYTLYAHMENGSLKVKKGDSVSQGQTIGYMGNTGDSYAKHLHFEFYRGGYASSYRCNPRMILFLPNIPSGSWRSAAITPANSSGLVTEESNAKVERLYGEDAPGTSAAICQEGFASSDVVVLARSNRFADAMSATGFAGLMEAPIVLTRSAFLSPSAREEIERLDAKTVYIIGGSVAVSRDVENEVSSIEGVESVTRIAGETAAETSVECARALAANSTQISDVAIVARSDSFRDALSISSFAYKYKVPIFLARGGELENRVLPAQALEMLGTQGPWGNAKLLVPGGTMALSEEAVEKTLSDHSIERIEGNTGYETSNEVATYMVKHGYLDASNVVIASGALPSNGVDALAGSALAGKLGCPIILVNSNGYYEGFNFYCIEGYVAANKKGIEKAYLLGGHVALPYLAYERLVQKI